VVVALDLEAHREPVTEVEDARVLARPLEDAIARARQPAEQERRVLVAAVLRPEQREDGELEVVRLTLEQRDDVVELPVRESELAMERVFDGRAQTASLAVGLDGPVEQATRRLRLVEARDRRASTLPGDGLSCQSRALPVSRYSTLLVTLAAIWGGSYLFIKIGIDGGFTPSGMMAARSLLAAAGLAPVVIASVGLRRALRELRASWRQWVAIGVAANALPFWLVAWGEKYIDTGVAAIAQATVPIFTVLLALRFLPHEPMGARRWAGIVMGLAGVGVLAGINPDGDVWFVIGTLAVVLSSLAYASGNIIGQLSISNVSGPVMAFGAMLAAGVALTPFALLQLPGEVPTLGAVAALLTLVLLGTVVAQLILYRMLRLYGGRRMSLVTYLMPPFALVYGAIFLDEPIHLSSLFGLALILGGVALGSGALGARAGNGLRRALGKKPRLDAGASRSDP
jgi:drug/metabolite transporter (DMT)-like permease